jgi:LPS-assembly lipoprotein
MSPGAAPACRRAALRLAAAVALVAALPGCGFRPRGATALPFRRVALVGFAPRSPMAAALLRALPPAVAVVASPAEAEVVVRALADERERSVAATTAAAQVRELQLRLRVVVRAESPAGRELMPAVELRLARDLTTSETAALAKAQEEEDLFREMQADVAGQLVRRLAAIRL